ncbi:MAG TPA: thiol oxidoreductase, partial [Leucothrix sp.]|nr:thiol oxidoreductase [Leucothrix sp.]
RRNIDDPNVRKGGELFESIGCVKCHTPSFVTGKETSFSTGGKHIKSVENQVIYPFSDMLLHDMGPGLADGRKDFDANGNEWKTRQLWGIGLTQRVNPGAGFLHDGRARTLEEAILWHGGESEGIKNSFMQLDADSRQQVIQFLNSL